MSFLVPKGPAPPPPPPPPPAPPTIASAGAQDSAAAARAAAAASGQGFGSTIGSGPQGAAMPSVAKQFLGSGSGP